MWFYVLVLIAGVGCIAAIASIIARKFPQLTLIDAESLPSERDAKRKREIIRARVRRTTGAWGGKLGVQIMKRVDVVRDAFRAWYRKLLTLERQYRREKPLSIEEQRTRVAALMEAAASLAKEGKSAEAEKKYIEALHYGPRNLDAYRALAVLYTDTKRYEQARDTYAFLAKSLAREAKCAHERVAFPFSSPAACPASREAHADIAKQYASLGLAGQSLGDTQRMRTAFERAVALEPSNPRYLDLLLEACILSGDKAKAETVFARFVEVNPENNKLESLREKIAAMREPERKTRPGFPGFFPGRGGQGNTPT